ncbi:integrase family protein [Methylorubrum extorquens CM4]|uniref:Integrase family protein n=2 Tax=Methylorubrum extorquens TaxID=408 RepID=B7L1A6_METC4|nr:integrase family protein [Methylorubrum extorquens CM4]
MERRSLLILTTKTDRAFQKRYCARLWEEATESVVGSIALPGLDEPVALRIQYLRGTAVTIPSEAGCSPQPIASITGHSLKTVTVILDHHLARTKALADQTNFDWENSPRTEFANHLQTATPTPKASKGKTYI